MGQTSSTAPLSASLHSLTIIKQQEHRTWLAHSITGCEYLLVRRIIEANNKSTLALQTMLVRRKNAQIDWNGAYVPQLVEFEQQPQKLCNQFATANMLFKHPSKNLKEEVSHRLSVDEQFAEGQFWTIIYSILLALKQYKQSKESKDVVVSESTVYIGNAGNVILSDIYKFEKDMCNGSVKLGDASQTECAQLKDLALMIERIIKRFKKVEYCEDTTKHLTASGDMSSYYLKNFIGMCLLEKIKSVDEALQKIIGLKDSYFYRKPQQSLIKAVVSPSKRTRKDKEANKQNTQQYSPILQLFSVIQSGDKRAMQQQKFKKALNNATNEQHNVSHGLPNGQCNITSYLYEKINKSKQNTPIRSSQHASHSQSCKCCNHDQPLKHETFIGDEQHPHCEDRHTYQLSDISSIKSQANRLTEQEELAINMTLSNNQSHPFVFPFDPTPVTQNLPSTFDLSQDSTICARNHTAGNFCDPKQKRDIFPTDIRPLIPERNLQAMKMLIYSQKDIIYEESENEVSELTSHRTKNHTRNVSNAFSAAESSN